MSRKLWHATYFVLTLSVGACKSETPPSHLAAASVSLPSESTSAQADWQQSSWTDGPGYTMVQGSTGYLFSGGVQVQMDGSLALSNLNATAMTIDNDLNNDRFKDIVVANSGNYKFVDTPFAQIRHQNNDHDMPNAQIYWGGPDGYDPQRTTALPGKRPSSLAAMDFNLDGILDLAVAGGGEFHPPYVSSYIYWGTRTGFSEQNSTALPTSAATGIAVGDFNKDGYPDVVFGNLGNYNFPFPPSLVYWGGPDGFSPQNRTELETHGVGGLATADLDGDGWLDIVFSNSAGFPPIDQLMDYGQDYAWPDSYVYLGGPKGFSNQHRISLPTKGATSVKVSDLNKDGHLDLVFTNAGSFALPPLPDTYIYWGSHQGFSTERRTNLATNGASAVSIADLNQDGWLDLVLSVTGTYLYIGQPKFPNSFVYWGGPDGFSDNRRLALPTEASQGNTIADVNDDGILDILFSQLGDFNRPYRPVLIYYGTGNPNAFYTTMKTGTLPGQISYGSIIVGPPDGGDHMSHGNLAVPKYDRLDAYVTKGQLIAAAHVSHGEKLWNEMSYEADIPTGTKAVLIIERSSDGQNWVESGHAELQSGQHGMTLSSAGIQLGPIMRYRLILTSADGSATPTVRSIQFR